MYLYTQTETIDNMSDYLGLLKVNNKVDVARFPRLSIRNDEIVGINVRYSGICGSDFQKYLHHQNVNHWGHEVIGELCNKTKVNAILKTSYPCGSCDMCLGGRVDLCNSWVKNSFNGFSEFVTANKNCIFEVPEIINPSPVYVLVEPMYVAMRLVDKLCPSVNDSVAIIGNGTIAILAAIYLSSLGVNNIGVFCRNERTTRHSVLEENGICCVNNSGKLELLCNFNKIINTAPYYTMDDVILNSAPHSFITFNGISTPSRVSLDMQNWHFKNITISPSFPHPQESFDLAYSFVRNHETRLSRLITHVIGIKEAPAFLEKMKRKEIDYVKVVIDMML